MTGRLTDGEVFSHLTIGTSDMERAVGFYDAVLAPLGGGRIMQFGDVIGFGVGGMPTFWIGPLASGVRRSKPTRITMKRAGRIATCWSSVPGRPAWRPR